MNPSDRQLVCRILSGQQEACLQFVDTHHQAIYRFLHHLCMDAHLAEDLAQETFTAAWTRLGTFNGSASLATWLHRIAYCKFIDSHRQRKRATPLEPGASLDEIHAAPANPLDTVLADEQERELYDALAQLSHDNREVLILHYFQGLTYREIADVLDIQIGLAKWRTSQALARLKSLLGER